MKVRIGMSLCLGEEVEVHSCMCGRERYAVEYGPYDKAATSHDKFKLVAGELDGKHQTPKRCTFGTYNA